MLLGSLVLSLDKSTKGSSLVLLPILWPKNALLPILLPGIMTWKLCARWIWTILDTADVTNPAVADIGTSDSRNDTKICSGG